VKTFVEDAIPFLILASVLTWVVFRRSGRRSK
jgi:hypothetical protein